MFRLAANLAVIVIAAFIIIAIAHHMACPTESTGPDCTVRDTSTWQKAKAAFGDATNTAVRMVDEIRAQAKDVQ